MEPRKFVCPEFILGRGALGLVGRYAANLAARKVLLVTDPGVLRAGWAGKVETALTQAGLSCVLFDGVSPDPKEMEVMAGAALYQQKQCNIIVAVGGGSPMDCAKGIGIVVNNHQPILEFEGVDRVGIPGPPLICIPTTAGTSADISQFAVITDTARHLKVVIVSKMLVPDVPLIDPVTTTTMDAKLTAATGMDALGHAIEAYVSNIGSPITDLHALEAIRLVATHLLRAIERPLDMEARDAMMQGSLLAGLAFSNASLGLVHAMAHCLGGLLPSISHGECCAMLLEEVVAFNFDSLPERYTRIAQVLGLDVTGLSPKETKEHLLEALADFRTHAGIVQPARGVGLKPADLSRMAQAVLKDPCLVTNPIQPQLRQIEQIYERLFL